MRLMVNKDIKVGKTGKYRYWSEKTFTTEGKVFSALIIQVYDTDEKIITTLSKHSVGEFVG